VLGVQIFNDHQVTGYVADGDNFNSFWHGMLSVFALSTTENFPGAFRCRCARVFPSSSRGLICCVVLGCWPLLSLVCQHRCDVSAAAIETCGRNAVLPLCHDPVPVRVVAPVCQFWPALFLRLCRGAAWCGVVRCCAAGGCCCPCTLRWSTRGTASSPSRSCRTAA
jgi:hypothetical protein